MSLNANDARQAKEAIASAKKSLMEALRILERGEVKLACQVGAMCAKAEVLERKILAAEQKPLTLRQFARQERL